MFYLTAVSLIWAISFGLIKGNLNGVDSNLVSAARMGLALMVFLPFVRPRGLTGGQMLHLAGIGGVQFGLMYVLYTWSFTQLKAYEVVLFTIMTPLYVSLIAAVLERRQRWIYPVAALLTIAGTAICVWRDLASTRIWLGFLAVQGSNVCFALGQVQYRRLMPQLKKTDADVFAILYAGGLLVALGGMLLSYHPAALNITHLWTLVYLGVIASGICFFLWNLWARRANVGALAVFNNLKIPLGILASGLLFHEEINWLRLAAGGAVIALALGINQVFGQRRKISV